MAPAGDAFHVDWVLANACNAHVANHRDWFSTYTPFPSRFFDAYGMDKIGQKLEGVGDVDLPVSKGPDQDNSSSYGNLTLRNVLYIPTATCNIFAFMIEDFAVQLGPDGKILNRSTGAPIALIDTPRLPRLRLVGQTSDRTSFDPNSYYMINGHWPESEQERWAIHTGRMPPKPTSNGEGGVSQGNDRPYDTNEKRWLKQHFGNEFKFLRTYGLSIYDEDERAEGRAIARAFMRDEEE